MTIPCRSERRAPLDASAVRDPWLRSRDLLRRSAEAFGEGAGAAAYRLASAGLRAQAEAWRLDADLLRADGAPLLAIRTALGAARLAEEFADDHELAAVRIERKRAPNLDPRFGKPIQRSLFDSQP